jgi:hypothetical protein
VPYFWIL